MEMTLVPRDQRNRSSEQIANELRRHLQAIPGTEVRTRAGEGLRVLRMGFNEDDNVEVEIRGHDYATLDALVAEVEKAMAEIPAISDARTSRDKGTPQELLRIDRQRAADLGLTVQEIARAIETSIGGTRAGNFREEGDEFPIQVRLRDAENLSLDDILDLTILNRGGEQISLRNVLRIEDGRGPNLVERKNQQRVAYVTGNLAEGDLGTVMAELGQRLDGIPRPLGYQIVLGGNFEEQQEAFRQLLFSLAVAILLVFMVLACLYESLRDPLVVMISVPMAAIGVILVLFLTDTTLNSQSFIGCIMLAGIVVNNAVLLVDQASQLRGRLGTFGAVREAGRRRLRPILMTTLTTVLGLLPLALGIGDGAEAQAPLARAVIGGLLSSTFISLILVPVFYTYVHREPRPGTAEAGAREQAPTAPLSPAGGFS
jgi:HAE1 family hydrophobic/amphiphilic exporter-1